MNDKNNIIYYVSAGIAVAVFSYFFNWVWICATLLALVIIVYAWIGYHDGANKETLADNCYLLGFIFTLFGLVLALASLSESINADSNSTESFRLVLGGFLAAIMSTMAGLVCRLIIRQGIVDTDDNPETAFLDKMRIFLSSVDNIINELGSFSERLKKTGTGFSEKIDGTMEKIYEDASKKMKESADAKIDAIKEVERQFSDIVAELKNNATAVKEGIQNLTSALQDIKAGEGIKDLSASVQDLNDVADTLTKTLIDASQQTQILGQIADSESEKLKLASEAVDKSLEATTESARQLNKIAKQSLDATTESADKLNKIAQDDVEEIRKIKNKNRDIAEQALVDTHKLYSSLLSGAKLILHSVKEGDIEKLGEKIDRLSKALESSDKK